MIIKRILFYILSFTWGALASVVGLIVMLPFLVTGQVQADHGRIYGIFPKAFGSSWGFAVGCFFFTSYDCAFDENIVHHEEGHGIQNIIWGPLMLFVITIPSVIRFWYRELKYYRKGLQPKTAYEDIWFEAQATRWGDKFFGDK